MPSIGVTEEASNSGCRGYFPSWLVISGLRGWAMQHMDLVSMAMPSTGAWGLVDLLIIFAMWRIMMIAMMVPSVTPMLLIFATMKRSRQWHGRVFVSRMGVPRWLCGIMDGI